METKLVSLVYVSNKSWVAGSNGRSSFKLHFLERDVKLPPQVDLQKMLNGVWQGTPSAFSYLAVKEVDGRVVTITLPPGTTQKARERFVELLEKNLRNKK